MGNAISHPILLFAFLVSLALFVPLLCERIRIPSIVGLIVAGMLFGPNGSGWILRGELVAWLGQAGLLFIVFVAGLEMDLDRFKRYRSHSIVFGSISYLLPQLIGTAVGYYVLDFGLASSVLLGSMFGSHTLLAYPVAARLGIVKSVPVTTTVGGTIITDVSALMVLAVIANAATGTGGWQFWALFAALLVVFTVLVFFVLPLLARWFYRSVPDEGARDFLFTLLLLFCFAWMADSIGLQPIIGAFLCGIAINRLIPERSPLMSRIQFVGKTLLVPMFLVSVGMLVDGRALIGDWKTIQIVSVMSVSVVATKWLAAFVSGKLLRYSADECWVVFGMSVNQAAATLAAVMVGFEIGLFPAAVVNGAIVMILVTCLLGPWCAEHWGRKVASVAEYGPANFAGMPQRLMIPLANPQNADALMDLALLLRDPGLQEPLFPLVIVTEDNDLPSKMASADKLLSQAVYRGVAAEATVIPVTRVDVNIAEGIRRALAEQQITTVLIGWSGRTSLAYRIFGGVLDQLLEQSRQTLMVARITESLRSARRIVLVIAADASRETTFPESLHMVKVVAQQLSANLLITGPDAQHGLIDQQLRNSRPLIPCRYEHVELLRDIPAYLDQQIHDDDMLVLLSARSHQLSWTHALESLPRQLAAQFPQVPFLVLYPRED